MSSGQKQSNWKRWGPEDQLGAINLVTPELTARACQMVSSGRVVSLGQDLGPATVVPEHRKQVERLMMRDGGDYAAGAKARGGFQFAEEVVSFAAHSGTHVDALAHAWYDDKLYNDHPSTSVRSTTGATRCGAEKLAPVVTRALLLDVASATEHQLRVGDAITDEHLQAAADRLGAQPSEGDAVLIRTGWYGAMAQDPEAYLAGEPGLDESAARWLGHADVAIVGADNFAIEVMPFVDETWFPVHQVLLRDLGVPLIEGMVLDELADLVTEPFLLIVSPVGIVGGTAGPVRPIAVL